MKLKQPHSYPVIALALAFALFSLPVAHATDFVWDGATTGNWSTNTNWDTDTAPDSTGTITISSGNNVNYDVSNNFLSGATLNLDGELTRSDVLRFSGSTFNVGSTGIISGGYKDLNNATLNFQDGAQFTATYWEQKGTNVFDFELSSTGFTALTPTNFANSTSPTTPYTTYTADLASYSGATQDVTLVDFGVSALDNATFTGGGQYTLSIDNTGTNAARLYYDDATEAVKLSINETVTWTGSGGDGKLSTAANWDTPDGKAPIANDTLLINNGATVAHVGALLGNSTISLVGSTLTTDSGAIRLNNATINVDATSSLTGGFWDLDGASIVFEDGALANMTDWEQKGINSFTYVLGTSDFLTLTPGAFRLGSQPSGLAASITNATYIVDFTNFVYELGSQSIILMDFSNGGTMTNATFQTASFNYINIDEAVTLENLLITWSDAADSMTLTFDVSVVPEPGTYALLGGLLALGYVMLRRRR